MFIRYDNSSHIAAASMRTNQQECKFDSGQVTMIHVDQEYVW